MLNDQEGASASRFVVDTRLSCIESGSGWHALPPRIIGMRVDFYGDSLLAVLGDTRSLAQADDMQ
jgi:hypothetical protein